MLFFTRSALIPGGAVNVLVPGNTAVNRTASRSPTAPQTDGVGSSSSSPATTAAAQGSLGVSPLSADAGASGAGLGVLGFYGLETFGLN